MNERNIVVVGVGNAWRRDDGAGPAVAALVRAWRDDVEVVELDGETARLVDAWHGADLAIVIDAVRSGAPPGTVRRVEPDGLMTGWPASSHGLGIEAAVALGRALGRLPGRLVVVGIEGADFAHGEELSPAVAAAVEPAARVVLAAIDELGAATSHMST